MPRLYVLSGDDVGRTYDIGESAVLGRSADADVTLRGASVSRRHARIERHRAGWRIVDLGSSNGTLIAGRRVGEAPLADGEEFTLGEIELRFRADVPEDASRVAEPAPPSASPPGAPPPEEPEPPDPPDPRAAETVFAPGGGVVAPDPVDGEAGAGGIELEGDWSDAAGPVAPLRSAPPPAPPATPERTPGARRAPREDAADRRAGALGAAASAAARGTRKTAAGGRVLQYHRVENAGGFLGADLAQQSLPVRILLYALALALFAALAFGTYQLTSSLRRSAAAIEGDVE